MKEILGQKSLNNTVLYTQLISFKDDEFTADAAHSEEEACKLGEAGSKHVWISTVTRSSESANDDRYKISRRGLGISAIDIKVDWRT